MTQPNQYTETVSVERIFSTPKFMVGYRIQDGTPDTMRTNTSKTEFSPAVVVLSYEAKPLATNGPMEWGLTNVLVKGPRLLAKGGTGADVKWTYSGWPCIDADDLDTFPRWLVQLIIVNLPKMVPFLGHETMTMETSWEEETYGDDLSPSAQPFEV